LGFADVLFRCGLVPDILRHQENLTQEQPVRHLDSIVGTDIGNFFGGWLSGHLIARGHSMGWARKGVVFVGAIGVTALIPTIFTADLRWLILLLSVSCFC
jgi:hypothetical protein